MIDAEHLRVSTRHAVHAEGLEQWRLQAHETFPLSNTALMTALQALGLDSSADVRNATPSVFVVDVLRELEIARLLQITRQSKQFRINGCTVAYEIICAGNDMWQSVQLSNPDPAALRSTMEALGVQHQPNVSMTAMLNHIAGLDSMRGELSAKDCGLDLQRIASLAKRGH